MQEILVAPASIRAPLSGASCIYTRYHFENQTNDDFLSTSAHAHAALFQGSTARSFRAGGRARGTLSSQCACALGRRQSGHQGLLNLLCFHASYTASSVRWSPSGCTRSHAPRSRTAITNIRLHQSVSGPFVKSQQLHDCAEQAAMDGWKSTATKRPVCSWLGLFKLSNIMQWSLTW